MPRPPRLQFPGAIYHIVTRGDGRRTIFRDNGHYARFTSGLADEVQRSAWDVIAYCWMPNHIHLLLRTPQPNLASGMQNWHKKRRAALAEGENETSRARLTRGMGTMTIDEVIATVADMHDVEPEEYVGFRSLATGREMAALRCRRYTSATLARLGEGSFDMVPLVRTLCEIDYSGPVGTMG